MQMNAYIIKVFLFLYLKKTDEIDRVYVNSVGEGAMWICNEGSNSLDIGDYVCSSSYQGYGMRQDDDLLHNYTVAKTTQAVDFSNSESVTLPNGIKAQFVGVTYHCA